ncbi:hypothetical protein HYQ46_002313 [Verticillium longisporum]|nr:hypothetical protein HYQ46_002313 [Verticillium longisporum]
MYDLYLLVPPLTCFVYLLPATCTAHDPKRHSFLDLRVSLKASSPQQAWGRFVSSWAGFRPCPRRWLPA